MRRTLLLTLQRTAPTRTVSRPQYRHRVKLSITPHRRTMSSTSALPASPHIQLHPTIASIRAVRQQLQGAVGLVPTMGALHAGHIDLVRASLQNNDHTVVSIYVNPTQFAPTEDLSSYPRTLEADLRLLDAESLEVDGRTRRVHHIFLPTNDVVYPPAHTHRTWVDLENIQQAGEGALRPTHFRGVCTVVSKLFNIVQPTTAYFGQKDGLQCIVIRKMVHDLNVPVNIHIVPTHRASDGLALSSRNVYLTKEERQEAPILYQSLKLGQRLYIDQRMRSVQQIKRAVELNFKTGKLGKLEYVNISHADTGMELQDNDMLDESAEYMLAVAYKLGKPRLIDNCMLSLHDSSKRLR